MDRALRLTRAVQAHDRELFCKKDRSTGVISLFRKRTRYELMDLEGGYILYSRPDHFLIFSLTDNWKSNGLPADWGIEPVMARLKAMDLWNRDIASDFIKTYEKNKESQKRDFKNNIEGFLHDFRSSFKRTFSDTNTSSMNKIDRRFQNGNH